MWEHAAGAVGHWFTHIAIPVSASLTEEESSEEGGQMGPEWRKGGGPGWPPGCGGLVRDRRELWIVPGFSGSRLENGMMNPN